MPEALKLLPDDEFNRKLVSNVHPPDWRNPEPAPVYNLIAIGGGAAGLVAAAGAAGLGAKSALIERHLLGGDCLNVGCVPSKTLIRAARAAREVARAAEFGIEVPPPTIDFGRVMARVRGVRAEISAHDAATRFRDLGVDLFLGEARFLDRNTIEVDGKKLRFKKAVIATGARAILPPIPGLAEVGALTNETVFSLTERPAHLAVLGAGPIGCEMAQAFRRLGSRVTLIEIMDQILIREDPDAAAIVERALRRDGVEIVLGARVGRVSRQGEKKVLHLEGGKEPSTITVDEILVGAGRAPNIETLDLEAAGVAYEKFGVKVNDHLQTSNPNIYAAGDVCLRYKFTHTADASARIALQNALFFGRKKMSALTIPWCTYTDPEIAHVGLYERDAEERGIGIDTFTRELSEVDRAIAEGETEGFVKIHVEKGKDRIVGATIVAGHAGETISEITLAIAGNLGLGTIGQVIHPYPTQAEAIKQVADAYNRSRLTPRLKKWMTRYFSWRR